MLINSNSKYLRAPLENEAEIEKVVQDFSEYLFGSSIVYLPKSKISTIGGAGTIPDGFVIDVESEEWFIVEAELAEHGTWQHIAPQVARQLTAADTESARAKLINIALDMVKSDKQAAGVFDELDIEPLDVHRVIQRILAKKPMVAIPIDAIPADLKEWVKQLNYDVKIWEIKKYVSEDGNAVLYSLPEDARPTIAKTISGGIATTTESPRWSDPYQEVFSGGAIHDGQKVFLTYGPRGKDKRTFEGVLRKNGVEIDGKVMSLSRAAVCCMKQAGSPSNAANGWIMWKTEDGTLLNDVYEAYSATKEKEAL